MCVDVRLKHVFDYSAAAEPPQTELVSEHTGPGPGPQEVGGCDITESSSELKPSGLDHNGEEGASGDVVVPPEIAAPEEGGGERSAGCLQLVHPS